MERAGGFISHIYTLGWIAHFPFKNLFGVIKLKIGMTMYEVYAWTDTHTQSNEKRERERQKTKDTLAFNVVTSERAYLKYFHLLHFMNGRNAFTLASIRGNSTILNIWRHYKPEIIGIN